MKIKTLLITLLFAFSMWAQNAAPAVPDAGQKPTATCCKAGAACCKSSGTCCKKHDVAPCCGSKETIARPDCCKAGATCCKGGQAKCCAVITKNVKSDCCQGSVCQRHGANA